MLQHVETVGGIRGVCDDLIRRGLDLTAQGIHQGAHPQANLLDRGGDILRGLHRLIGPAPRGRDLAARADGQQQAQRGEPTHGLRGHTTILSNWPRSRRDAKTPTSTR
jgi:hypothetical protein